MNQRREYKRSSSCLWWMLVLLIVVASIIYVTINLYRPDDSIAAIVPGSSAKPSFFVQLIRPRAGLPLGGLLPPQLFGVDAKLGFDSNSDSAKYRLDDKMLELASGKWKLRLLFDTAGQIHPDTEIIFDLIFEDQVRRVRCTPGDQPGGSFQKIEISSDEFAGSFEIELPVCEDASTGQSLGWPPRPFILRGSFDRLQNSNHPE